MGFKRPRVRISTLGPLLEDTLDITIKKLELKCFSLLFACFECKIIWSFMELQVNMVMDMDKMRIKDNLVHGMY